MDELVSPRMSPKEVAAMMRPLELDLMAAYAAARDDVIEQLHKSAEAGEEPETFIQRALDLIGGSFPEDVEKALPSYPEDHPVGMVVPPGGSSCAKCEHWSLGRCLEPRFIKWNGSGKIPTAPDRYCCDFFEAESAVTKARKLQGRTEFQGLPISIENRKGSVRSGTDADGEEWRTKMTRPYGYIRGTEGTDGDQVDVFLGPDRNATTVFVVHTQDPDTKEYDEDKVMLGFPSEQAARTAFLENYDSADFLQNIESMGFDEFMDRIRGKGEKIEKSVAVDFDGTLAESVEPFAPGKVGPAIPEMVRRVRALLEAGKEVVIFTARVASTNDPGDVREARRAIQQFCEEQFDGRRLEVTAEKTPDMERFIDDRAENPTVTKDWVTPHQINPALQESVKVEDAGTYGDYRVFVVDDRKVEELFDPDWAGGGNHMAKPYVPDMELWVGQRVPDDERDEYLEHEAGEDWQMRTEGQDYDTAHNLVTVGEMAERLNEDEGGGRHRTMSDLLGKALAVDLFPIRVAFAAVDDAVWKGIPWPVGDVHNLKGTLWLRIKKTDGKWGDFKKLGPAPQGWSVGDPVPEDLKAQHEEAKKLIDPNAKKPEKQPAAAQQVPKVPKPKKPAEEVEDPQQQKAYHEKLSVAYDQDKDGFAAALAVAYKKAHPDMDIKLDKLHSNIMGMDKGAVLQEAKAVGLDPSGWGKIPEAPEPEKEPGPGLKGLLSEFDAPPKLPPIEKTEDLGGTTGAKKIVFEHPVGGKYTGVLKHGASEAHAVEEHQANLLYAMMGVHVPASHLYEHDGKKAMVSAWVDGKTYTSLSQDQQNAVKYDLRQHFAADALLGNWDVTGADFDNILWDGSKTIRIDNGGALRFRAQGAPKEGSFGPTVPELETMRDPTKLAGKLVFAGLPDKEVSAQIKKIVAHKAEILSAVKDAGLKKTLGARIDYMKQWAEDKAKAPAKPAAPPPKPAEHPHGKVVSQKPLADKLPGIDYPPLREHQQSAFRSYQQGAGVNGPLRSFLKPGASDQKKIDAMDAYYAEVPEWDIADKLKHPLWRGVDPTFMGNWFKGLALPKFDITAADLDKKTPAGKITWREALTKTMVGAMFFDQGYFGSSVKEDVAHGFMHMPGQCSITNTGAHVKFVVTGKTKAVEVESLGHGGYNHEAEVLWPRGQGFRVKGVEFKNKGKQNWIELHVEAEEGF